MQLLEVDQRGDALEDRRQQDQYRRQDQQQDQQQRAQNRAHALGGVLAKQRRKEQAEHQYHPDRPAKRHQATPAQAAQVGVVLLGGGGQRDRQQPNGEEGQQHHRRERDPRLVCAERAEGSEAQDSQQGEYGAREESCAG